MTRISSLRTDRPNSSVSMVPCPPRKFEKGIVVRKASFPLRGQLHAEHQAFGYVPASAKLLLQLFGVNILAVLGDDYVFFASGDARNAVFKNTEIPGDKPSIRRKYHSPCRLHGAIEPACLPAWHVCPGIREETRGVEELITGHTKTPLAEVFLFSGAPSTFLLEHHSTLAITDCLAVAGFIGFGTLGGVERD